MRPPPSTTSRAWLLPLVVAAGLDAMALASWLSLGGAARGRVVALGLHLFAVGAAAAPTRVGRSQRALMAALTLTLPFLGALVAIVALSTRRRGELAEVPARDAPEPRALSVADVRRLTDGLSASESLMSGSPDERSATLGMLTRHPDAAALALLRRAVASGDADTAVEAALALEDLDARVAPVDGDGAPK